MGSDDYTTPDGNISFINNPKEMPQAYALKIKGNFVGYIPHREIPELTKPSASTEDVMRRLDDSCNKGLRLILGGSLVCTTELHLALMQLRTRNLGEQLQNAYTAALS